MANQYIAVALDGPGKKLQTYENTISGNVVQAEAVALVDTSGAPITTLPVSISQPATSTVTSVANSVTSVTLLSSNANRRAAMIFNDAPGVTLIVKFGTTASSTSLTIKMAPSSYYEFPSPVYTGRVDAIASAATGSARITELT